MNAIASAACPPLAAQTVLVTGGARGLGRTISEAFLAQGARVLINCLHSLEAARALATQHPGQALAVQADVRDAQAVQAMLEQARAHFGAPVCTVVNNALPAFSFNSDARPHANALS